MDQSLHFDLIVIGGGSAGVACARRAASYGARVAMIEASRVGGTCVLRGCVPKKLLMYAAQMKQSIELFKTYGLFHNTNNAWEHFQWDAALWQASKNQELARLENIYEQMLKQAGVKLFQGHARLMGKHSGQQQVAIDTEHPQTLYAQHIVIATGSLSAIPAIPGTELAWTSNELLNLERLPKHMVVLGGGYIASEFASHLNALGSSVTQIMRSALLLRGFDESLRMRMNAAFERNGITLKTQTHIAKLEKHGQVLRVFTTTGEIIEADAVLNALGRLPNSKNLGLENTQARCDAAGYIQVNQYYQTDEPQVYAIGDVVNQVQLTPFAITQGRALADSLFHQQILQVLPAMFATAVFALPQLACIGYTEQHAQLLEDIDIYEAEFRPLKTAFAQKTDKTYMKLIVAQSTQKVLGVHMLGEDAAEIVQSLAVALTCQATKAQFDATLALHPSAAEEFMLMRTRRSVAKAG